MSVASSSELLLRRELWDVMRVDLAAAGVPVEAWPRRLPRIYHAYTVRSRGPGRAPVQVLLAVRGFLVPRPLPEWDRGHSVHVAWDNFLDVASAWAFAKRVAGW